MNELTKDLLGQIERSISGALAPLTKQKADAYAQSIAPIYSGPSPFRVTSAQGSTIAAMMRAQVKAELAALEEVRKAGPGALYSLAAKLQKIFTPLVQTLEAAEKHLKREQAEFVIRERRAQAEAYKAGAEAYKAGNVEASTQLLAVSNEAQTATPEGLRSVSARWRVKSADVEQLPEQWTKRVADLEALDAYAAAVPYTQDPPPIPGVVFELDARPVSSSTK